MKDRYLPKDWKIVQLKDVARIFAGSSAPQDKSFFDEAGPPFVRVSDLGEKKRTTCLIDSRDHLSQKAIRECNLILARKGSVLFPKSGAAVTTNNRAILGIDAQIVSHLMAIEPDKHIITPLWLYWTLCQIDMMKYSDNIAYPSLKQSTVENISVVLPPIAEQKRIESILSKQLSSVEQAKAAAAAQLEAAKALPAAYLREIFNSPEFQKWPRKSIKEICEVKGGKRLPKGCDFSKSKTLFPYIRVVDLQFGTVNLSDLQYLDEETHNQIKRYIIKKENVYISIAGTIGVVGTIPDALDGANLTENAARLIIQDSSVLLRDFLALFLQSDIARKEIKLRTNQVGQPKLALERIKTIEIPLPPVSFQAQVLNELNKKMQIAKHLQDILLEQDNTLSKTPDSLLHKAFNGEL